MPIFLATAKYKPEALAAARKASLAARAAASDALTESAGGRSLGTYFPVSPDWDILSVAELPSAEVAYAIQSMAMASGAMERFQITQLLTGTEADAAIDRTFNWTPPGRGSHGAPATAR